MESRAQETAPVEASARARERRVDAITVRRSDRRTIEDLPAVGENLRRLRRRKGYSLERLAQASGVSRAMLSQIERARSTPTIQLLWRIAHGLAVPFSALIGALVVETRDDAAASVLRAGDAPDLKHAGVSTRALFPLRPPDDRGPDFYQLHLDPLAVVESPAYSAGTTTNVVVHAGYVEILVGEQRHELGSGDAIYFRADVGHRIRNAGRERAVLYVVRTQPNQSPEPR